MKKEAILVTQRVRFAADSSMQARAMEKFRLLNAATLKALRQAGEERELKDQAQKVAAAR
jgi:hypothetical protein